MRSILIATLLAGAALGQSTPPDVKVEPVAIRLSADGTCHFLDIAKPCAELGQYLLSKHLVRDGHLHITVDRTARYEVVAAALKSLQSEGFKIGFVNADFVK